MPTSKREFKVDPLVTEFNSLLPDLNSIIQSRLPMLYSDPINKNIFLEGSIRVLHKRGKNLKEILSPSLFPSPVKSFESSLEKCDSHRCECANYMIFKNKFSCFATDRVYRVYRASSVLKVKMSST